MIVTLNEVQRACQKALFGAGAPPGLDDDGASAAVWLESRGLPALASFAAALERWADDPSAAAVTETAPGVFDAGGRSAVFIGSLLIDMAVARAGPIGTAALEVLALCDPRFLVPWAADYLENDRSFAITWDGRAASTHLTGGVTLFGDWNAGVAGSCDVAIECRSSGQGAFDLPLPAAYRKAELETRFDVSLSTGLEVNDAIWQTIGRYAHRVLVPASAESRARGAGSVTSDNE